MPKMSYNGFRLGQRLLSPVLAFALSFSLSPIAPLLAESEVTPNQPAATVITVDTSEDLDPTSLNKTCTFTQGAIFFPASDGKCTLRRAINEAAARPQGDRPIEIRFNLASDDPSKDIEVAGTWTLPIDRAFPRLKTDSITNKNGQVTIDGNTQPGGRTTGPKIIINSNDNSLEVESEKNIIRNLSFKGGGVIFLKEDGNLVEKIWMGLSDDGQSIHFRTPGNERRMAGGGIFITSNGNTVQDNVISGAFAKAVDIGSNIQNNIIQRNFIGTRADGTVPTVPAAAQCLRSFNYDLQNWYGGWGIAISGSNNKVLNNRIAGLHILQSANDTPPMAIEIFGANHTVQGNIIGVDSAGKKVGVCGQGIKVSGSGTQILDNEITRSRIGFEDIIPTAILASDTSPLFGQITVRGNYVEDGPGGIYEMGPGLPKFLQEFEPAKITNINGKNVSGTAGNGSPCPGCIIDFYSDDLDSIGEAFTYLGQETADSNGDFSFAMTQTLPSGAGIRTSSTAPSAGVIGSYGTGTTTKFSKLYYPLSSVEITGPLTGTAGITYTFMITVSPFGPESLNYSVKATDVTTLTATSKNHAVTVSYNWKSAGSKDIEVKVTNDLSAVIDTHKITISGNYQEIPTPTVPAATPTVPTATPTAPTETPTVPTETPTVPTATPTVPTATPTVPTATPTVPTATPTVPTATPTVPTATPTAPTATPTAPTAEAGDTYENDDTCPIAHSIPSDAIPQTHTFHKPGDADWLRFDATLNKSYRIDVTIPDGSTADVDLTLYNSCDSVPADQWNASFTPSVRLEFTSTVTGAIYLRLSNYDATVAGSNVKYEVSVQKLTAETANRALIIVAGRLRGADRLQSNIHKVTQRVYTLFQRNEYTDDNIYYLATDSRLAGYDAAANKANLKAAITQWAKEKLPANGVLTLYMIDHGSPELFYLDEVSGQRLTPDELNDWLTQLEDAVSGLKINVIIEACESGSFINLPGTISKAGRIVVTSTNADYDAKASKDGAYFSDHLLTWLHQGYNLSASFLEASIVAKRVFALQTAWLDANGNGIPNELADAALAAQRSFAYEGTLGADDWPPYIFSVEGPQAVNNASGQINVDARDNLKVRTVWAVVYPPDYTPPAAQEELQAEFLPTILLSATDNGDIYAGVYPGFIQNGVYRIVVHAEDNDGLVARPVEIEVTVGSKIFLPLVTR